MKRRRKEEVSVFVYHAVVERYNLHLSQYLFRTEGGILVRSLEWETCNWYSHEGLYSNWSPPLSRLQGNFFQNLLMMGMKLLLLKMRMMMRRRRIQTQRGRRKSEREDVSIHMYMYMYVYMLAHACNVHQVKYPEKSKGKSSGSSWCSNPLSRLILLPVELLEPTSKEQKTSFIYIHKCIYM